MFNESENYHKPNHKYEVSCFTGGEIIPAEKYIEDEKYNRVFALYNNKVYSTQLRRVEWLEGYKFVRLDRMPYKNVPRRWQSKDSRKFFMNNLREYDE